MHYTSTIASRNFGQKTMTAKFNPVSCLRKLKLNENYSSNATSSFEITNHVVWI